MNKIQEKVIKREKRGVVSRYFHAKNDKDMIATWRFELNGILHVFNVCFVTSVQPLLTFRFQTELGDDKNQAVSTIRTLCHQVNTYHCVESIQVGNPDYN